MKTLPPGFEGHSRWEPDLARGDCLLCDLWDEPAWFWHADVPPPGTLAEDFAKLREAGRLAGLELLALAERTLGRWLLRR